MIYIPFIYFSLLTVFLWKKGGTFNIGSYMSLLYAITSFFSLLVDQFDLYDGAGIYFSKSQISIDFLPVFTYCTLITISILPFWKFSKNLKDIELTKTRLFNGISYFFIMIFLLTLILSVSEIKTILSGDLEAQRMLVYEDERKNLTDGLSGIMYLVAYIVNIFYSFSPLMLVFFFYSITFLKRNNLFNTLLFLSSLSQMILATLNIDRTEFIYYLLMVGFCLVFFKSYFTKKQYYFILKVFSPLFILIVVYTISVTIARFGDRDGGAGGGFIQYAGQSFLNFCYFFNNYQNPDTYLVRLFPFTSHFIFNENYDFNRVNHVVTITGIPINVFSSFIGTFMVDVGKLGMIITTVLFTFISKAFLRKKKSNNISFAQLIPLFILSTIPVFGIFYYRYYSYVFTFYVIISIFLYSRFKRPINNH